MVKAFACIFLPLKLLARDGGSYFVLEVTSVFN